MSDTTIFGVIAATVLAVILLAKFRASWIRASVRADRGVAELQALPPARPEGVRIEHADGSETLCDLAYHCLDEDGMHIWKVMTPFNPLSGDRLHVGVLPGRTGLALPTTDFGRGQS